MCVFVHVHYRAFPATRHITSLQDRKLTSAITIRPAMPLCLCPLYGQINHLASVAGQTGIWAELRDRKIHAKTINLSKGESACIIH